MITVNETTRLGVVTRLLGVPTDPTALTIAVTSAGGVVTVYTYGVDPEVVRTDAGTFYFDLTPNAAGLWSWVWSATGTVTQTNAGNVQVTPLPVPVTITVQTSAPVPIPGALVQLFAASGAVFGAGMTSVAGAAKVTVPPGVYQVEVTKSKGVFPAAQMVTVTDSSGAPQAFTVTGSMLAIVGPLPAARRRLFGYMIGGQGGPAVQKVILETLGAGYTLDWVQPPPPGETGLNPNNLMVAREKWEVPVDGEGYWETDVVVGSRVRVWIPETHFETVFTVPNFPPDAPLNIADVRVDLGFRPQDENPSPRTF